jgi:hypothetical protein
MMLSTVSLHPPRIDTPDNTAADEGQRLLALLKRNKSGDLRSVVSLLQTQISRIERRGLLQEDVAEKILTSASKNNGNTNNNGSKRKGKRGRNNSTDGGPSTGAPALDVTLQISAISRILDSEDCLLTALGADWITVVCDRLNAENDAFDPCFLATYEVLTVNVKPFLTSLEKQLQRYAENGNIDSSSNVSNDYGDDDEETRYACTACLRACVSLIGVIGTKLSRSTNLLNSFEKIAYRYLPKSTQAARLLATLPFAVEDTWSRTLSDTVQALRSFLHMVVSVESKATNSDTNNMRTISSGTVQSVVLGDWVRQIQQSKDCSARVVQRHVQGLVRVIECLLNRDAIGVGAVRAAPIQSQLMMSAQVPVDDMLALIESMLSFSAKAEATYFQTKKRLRHEPIEGGLFSSAEIVESIANAIRVQGHLLLDTLVLSLGTAALLPFARKITRITSHGLNTSASTALRLVLDQSSAVQLEGKKRRWLHTSIPVRTAAIQSFRRVVSTFGTDAQSLSSSSSRRGNDMDRSITTVCGCLVGELSRCPDDCSSKEWGTLDDRIQLVAEAVTCLTACINCGGEYLSPNIRNFIDSVAATCIKASLQCNQPVISFGPVRATILDLASACLRTPWQDGTRSSIELLTLARSQQLDRHDAVRAAATSALQLCHALDCPRVPALNVVTRSNAFTEDLVSSRAWSAQMMDTKLQKAAAIIDRATENSNEQPPEPIKIPTKKATTQKSSVPASPLLAMNAEAETVPKESPCRKPVEVAQSEEPQFESTTEDMSEKIVSHGSIVVEETLLEQDQEEDPDFPMIVDCGPDHEDE